MKTILPLLAILSLVGILPGFSADPSSSEPADTGREEVSVRSDLVAHEWGTFTQVVGSDGSILPWWTPRLEGPAALPEFVKPVFRGFGKTGTRGWRMRMETPVIYFYADRPADLVVTVDESQVPFTEVFPMVTNPIVIPSQMQVAPDGSVRFANETPGALRRWEIGIRPPEDEVGSAMPQVGEQGDHYRYARDVPDAWWVVKPESGETSPQEVEKFIFYRGAGDGSMPHRIAQVREESVRVWASDEPVYLVETDRKELRWTRVVPAAPDEETSTVELLRPNHDPEARSDEEGLAAALANDLDAAGLTRAEAEAMVATWHESWLGESGLRALELLPRDWVDRTLPLSIEPQPREVERVFVARWELLAPELEEEVLEIFDGSATTERKMSSLKSLDLGRFGTALFDRVATIRDSRFRAAYRGLVADLNP